MPAVTCQFYGIDDVIFLVLLDETRRTGKRRCIEWLIFFGEVASMRVCHGHSLYLSRSDGISRLKGRLKVVHDPEVNWSLGKLILNFFNLWHFLVKSTSVLFGWRLYFWLNAKRKVFDRIIHILQNDAYLRVSDIGSIDVFGREALAWIPGVIGFFIIAVLDEDIDLRAVVDGTFAVAWCWNAKMSSLQRILLVYSSRHH